jgi:hypothetical protein
MPYNPPIPPRAWSRVQNKCTFIDPSLNNEIVGQYTSQMLSKGNVLQYKKNSSSLTKNQRYSQIAKGYWTNRTRTYATQSQTYTNPNTASLLRVNYKTIPFPNDIVGSPNNISGPYQYAVPNPFGCPTYSLQDGGNLVCNTIANPCTQEVIEKTYVANCYPTTDSNVPGRIMDLCWDSNIPTWYPRQRYIMTNSGDKFPQGYKLFVAVNCS